MTTEPQISVVMSVYNEESCLNKTIDSVLSQTGVELELIIVNDGSTDQSEAIIRQRMREDSRVILVNQPNQGLTKSLIDGCQRAKGVYIARQDAGDISQPNRLSAQLDAFESNSELAIVSTATAFAAPDGEIFTEIIQSEQAAEHGLKYSGKGTLQGPPHHGSVMFRRDLYNRAGGYRSKFVVAQDLDLWTRLIELGGHISLQAIYYVAGANKDSISALRRPAQIKAMVFIERCCETRQAGGSDKAILESMDRSEGSPNSTDQATKKTTADFYYFIASNLLERKNPASRKYFKKALIANPWHLKARLKLLRS